MVSWQKGLTAFEAIQEALSVDIAQQIAADLVRHDNHELTVSWASFRHDDHSEVGGVSSLDWEVEDESILAITYEDKSTSDQLLDESSEWMLSVYNKHTRSS